MRDIKPTNKPGDTDSGKPTSPLPSPKKLYSKPENPPNVPATPKKPRFTGSRVPVAATQENTEVPAMPPARKLSAADEYRTKEKQPGMRLGDKERKLVAILILLVVVVLGLAGFLFLPKATVTLTLQTAPLLLDQELILQNTEAPGPGIIPAKAYTETVEVQGASAVTTRKVVGTKATGTVRIVNDTIDEQQIREQSRLVTADDTLFYMQQHAIIPPGSSTTVAIEAAEAGEEGNVSAQRLDFAALDESAQSIVYAQLDSPTTGGSGKEVPVVADEDIARAKEEAGLLAREQIEEGIIANLPADWVLLEESWSATLEGFTTDVEVGAETETIPYTSSATLHVFTYEQKSLEESLRTALESRLDENHMLFPEPISFTKSVDSVDWEREEATITVRVTHTTIPSFSLDTLQEKLAGRTEEEAIAYLKGLPGVENATIDFSAVSFGRVPRITKRIVIDVISDRNP